MQLLARKLQTRGDFEVAQIFDGGFGGCQRQRLATEGGEEEDVFFEQPHHLGTARQHRKRHAVGHSFGEAGQVCRHVEALLGAAERDPEARPHFVEDQKRAGVLAGSLQNP